MLAGAPRIVVLDDEPQVLMALDRKLRQHFQVFATQSWQQALEAVDKESVDVVLTDLRMPEMDGMRVLDLVRQKNDSIVRMLMTGYWDAQTVNAAMEPGSFYHINKPWHDDLTVTIVRALEHKARMQALKQDLMRTDRLANVGVLVSRIAHDINNHLASFGVNFDFLNHTLPKAAPAMPGDVAQEVEESLGDCITTLESLKSIIRSLSDFSHASSEPTVVRLADAYSQAVKLLSLAKIAGLTVSNEIDTNTMVVAPSGDLTQLILGLLLQTLQTMGFRGELRVRVRAEADKALIEIADVTQKPKAPGLDFGQLNYYRLPTLGENGESPGLSAARELVHAARGTLAIEHAPGQRFAATVRLPRASLS